MFQKYVVLVDYMRFGPTAEKGNNWAIREAVSVNGRHFGVWNGPKSWRGRGQLGVSGLGFVFKHREAAELEIERLISGNSMEGTPTLYTVSAVTISGALESVVDQVYGGNWHGVERIQ